MGQHLFECSRFHALENWWINGNCSELGEPFQDKVENKEVDTHKDVKAAECESDVEDTVDSNTSEVWL